MIRFRMLGALGLTVALLASHALLGGAQPKAKAQAEPAQVAAVPAPAPVPPALLAEIDELKRVVAEQARQLASQRKTLEDQQEKIQQLQASMAAAPGAAATPSEKLRQPELDRISGELDAVAQSQAEITTKVNRASQEFTDTQKKNESRFGGLGNFRFSGDVRLRYEPFFQGGGFTTRQRERIRARLNITGKLTDEVSGGISIATGSLDDVNSTNQTLTGFFTRKTIGFDRYFLTYKPNWWKPLSLTAGKFVYPWYRTPLTFDSDINPEGFAQTFSFDIQNPILKNITLVGFELPFNEASGSYDSFIFGGQLQTRWKFGDRLSLRLYAAGVNFNRADPIAVAVANGTLKPSLPNTNRFRTNASGQVVGYQSKFLYLDLIGVLDYNLHPRFPMQLQFNFVNNTRATTAERGGYWAEVQFGRLSEQKDVQFGYSFVRVERDAVIAAFNESDLRAATNVRNHRLNFGYQAYKNISLVYTLWLGRLANPQDNSSQVPPDFRTACSTAPFTGCQDPHLKRMQFDIIYKF